MNKKRPGNKTYNLSTGAESFRIAFETGDQPGADVRIAEMEREMKRVLVALEPPKIRNDLQIAALDDVGPAIAVLILLPASFRYDAAKK